MSFSLIAKEDRKARKAHPCIWCGQKILVGEKYTYRRYVFEGDPQSDHLHKECEDALRKEASEYGYDYEFAPYDNERPTVNTGGDRP